MLTQFDIFQAHPKKDIYDYKNRIINDELTTGRGFHIEISWSMPDVAINGSDGCGCTQFTIALSAL